MTYQRVHLRHSPNNSKQSSAQNQVQRGALKIPKELDTTYLEALEIQIDKGIAHVRAKLFLRDR